MKILVTGGAGFIGSHLCEELAKDPSNEIVSLDNYSSGSVNNEVKGVTYFRKETKYIDELDFNPDIIYHLGEYSRVENSFKDIEQVIRYNKIGTLAVLEYVRKYKCKLIYAGSSTKFGDNGSNSSPYAWSKASNTELVKNYGEWFGIDYAITYFYNVYGGREIKEGKYATLIGLFESKTKSGEPLTVVSPGTQARNFTHISDIISGLILVGKYGSGDSYGIGNDKAYSILDIAESFGGQVIMLPERRGNRMTAPDVSSKTRALGWTPKVDIKDYIKNLGV